MDFIFELVNFLAGSRKPGTKRAWIAGLQSLRNQVVRIERVAKFYSEEWSTTGGIDMPRMPVTVFEPVFVSGSPALTASPELLSAVHSYLVLADYINSAIDVYQAGGGSVGEIRRACNQLPAILDRLDNCLQREIEAV